MQDRKIIRKDKSLAPLQWGKRSVVFRFSIQRQ